MTNIYRQAKQLLDKRDTGGEISWAELQLIKTAELPLILRGCPLPEDMPLAECLEELAKSVEQAIEVEKPSNEERARGLEKPKGHERASGPEKPRKRERAPATKIKEVRDTSEEVSDNKSRRYLP